MTAKLDVPDTHTDLLESPYTSVLTTVGADGLPQSTAVWYLAGPRPGQPLHRSAPCRKLGRGPDGWCATEGPFCPRAGSAHLFPGTPR